MGFFRNLFFGRSAVHDDGERIPCAQCRLDELPSNPDLQRAARDRTVALAAAGYRDQPATVYDYGYADEIVPVVLDLPPVVVIDELPIVAVSVDFGCPAVVDNVAPTDFGGADTFGGGGADGTWPTD